MDPQRNQFNFSDEDPSEEVQEDEEKDGNSSGLLEEHAQEFHGYIHHSVEALAPKKNDIKNTKSKDKMKADSIQGPSKSKQKRVKREVLQVHGEPSVRSNGKKDHHSKVCTARGPRDRRVRLSPQTAIQFYDVQDRLGYDRPSKAIDWLMKKAKAAIDALDESNNAASLNPSILMEPGDRGTSELALHDFHPHGIQYHYEYNSSRTTLLSPNYFNQISNSTYCSSISGPNRAIATPSNSTDFLNFSLDDHLRNKYQRQGLCLSFHSTQDFPSFVFADSQQAAIPVHNQTNTELASGQSFHTGTSNSCNAKGGEEGTVNWLPLQFPSVYDENHPLNSHREPLQSSFSASLLHAPFHDQHPSLNSFSSRFSSDGVLGLSAPTFHGEDEQTQVSCKHASSTACLLRYQE